jgi:hypothetical protein
MTRPAPPPGPSPFNGKPNGRIALGLLLIGLGRARGFAQFGATNDAFLASLAPLLGFLIVLAGLVALTADPLAGLDVLLVGLCHLLAPAVIADLFCRLWHRRQGWAHFANVLNCAPWLMVPLIMLLLPFASLGVLAGLSAQQAVLALYAGYLIYMAWFQWFAARHALNLPPGRALIVVVSLIFGTALLTRLPTLIAGHNELDRIEVVPISHDTDGS